MQSLQRLREPAAVVLLIVLGLRLVLGLLTIAVFSGASSADTPGGVALFGVGYSALDVLVVVVLVAVLVTCLLSHPTPHASSLARVALMLVAAGVLVSLVAGVVGLFSFGFRADTLLNIAYLLLQLAVPVLGIVALHRISTEHKRSVVPAQSDLALEAGAQQRAAAPDTDAPAVSDDHEPIWQPEAAAGAAWLTAGEAAKGAAASGWGTSNDPSGWAPQPVQRRAGDSTDNGAD